MAGILGETVIDNTKMADQIVNASFHNATFSDRIWLHQDLLKHELDAALSTGLIQGRNPRALASEITKIFGAKRSDAERLMRTELARVQIGAQEQSLKDNDFDWYEFIAGQAGQCEVCAALDGKHFEVRKMVIGENAPPMHPNCRCSIAPWEADRTHEITDNSTGTVNIGFRKMARQTADDEPTDEFPSARVLSKKDKKTVLEYAEKRNINIHGINNFDGDINILKEFMDEIYAHRKEFPRVFSGKRITLAFGDMEDGVYAITHVKTITLNNKYYRNREFTEKDMRDSKKFTNPTIEGIARHELGHIVEGVHGEKGLRFAREVYYNIHGRYADRGELVHYIRNEVSYYAYPTVKDSITKEVSLSEFEITSEVLSSDKENNFVLQMQELWKKEGLK